MLLLEPPLANRIIVVTQIQHISTHVVIDEMVHGLLSLIGTPAAFRSPGLGAMALHIAELMQDSTDQQVHPIMITTKGFIRLYLHG